MQHLKIRRYVILAVWMALLFFSTAMYAGGAEQSVIIGSTAIDNTVTDVPAATSELYDETVLRTISLTFAQTDWWQQMINNHDAGKDENVLADLTIEGITYPGVGVRFKGMTSYNIGNSQKKSFNIEMNATDPDQKLMGYKTLNLNNANLDPSFIREPLYFSVVRRYLPCPKVNFVKLIINGENWGVYVNVQQINADLIKEWFKSSDGDRWKVTMQNFSNGQGGAFPGGGGQQPTFAEWFASPIAQDVNSDGQITEEDYQIFITSWTQPFGQQQTFTEWAASPMAQDLNGDEQITEEDYQIFITTQMPSFGQQLSFTEWVASPMAQHLNGDGQITEEDYQIFITTQMPSFGQQPTFTEWAASPAAQDLNGDEQITEEDYQIFITTQMPSFGQQLSFTEWVASPMAQDLNGDGQITEEDYQIFITTQPPPGGMMPGGTGALSWLGTDPNQYKTAYEIKAAKTSDPWGNLIITCDILNNTPLEQLPDILDSFMAVDRWLWFLAVENIFTDEDSYWTKGWDYQIYYEVETGRIHPIEHDGNETFKANSVNLSPFEGVDSQDRPVISILLSIPQFRQRYLAHMKTIINECFNWDALSPKIAAYKALIGDEVKADTKKLYSNDQFETSFTDLENFIKNRRNYLLTYEEINRPVSIISSVVRKMMPGDSDSPLPWQSVVILAKVEGEADVEKVILHYAPGVVGFFGSVPMFDDGAHGDGEKGDSIFAAEIPPFPADSLVRYYVEVQSSSDSGGSSVFVPAGAEDRVFAYQVSIPVTGPATGSTSIVINELMAVNQATIQDPQGEYEDWIELLNISNQVVDLSGMYLSDKEDKPLKWKIPEGTTIAPGAYLLIWADEDSSDTPGLHTNFKFSADGESALLVDTDARGNSVLDSVVFGKQEADVSLGRFPNGIGQFQVLSTPTPNSVNLLSVTGEGTPAAVDPDLDGDGYTVGEGDCADNNMEINPTAAEVCDGIDNDCDGKVDEDLTRACSSAFGNGTETCQNGNWIGCTAPTTGSYPDACSEEDSGHLDIGGSQGKVGDEVRILVKVQSAPNAFSSFGFDVTYDPSVLEYAGYERGDLLISLAAIFNVNPTGSGRLTVGGFIPEGDIPQGTSTNLVWLKFKVTGGMGGKCYPLRAENLVDDIVGFSLSQGCFCIRTCSGDITGDGVVTPKDALDVFKCY